MTSTLAGPVRTTSASPKAVFRALAVAEAVTWVLLLAGMVAERVLGLGDLGVVLAGPVHGLVFLAFVVGAVLVAVNQRWHLGVTLAVLASSLVPLATVAADAWLERTGRLEGGWRTDATDDPRERRLPDRVLRWLLARPLVLVAGATVGVVAVFAALMLRPH
jgi:integral membrane protein